MTERFEVHASHPHSAAGPEFWFIGLQMSTVKPMTEEEWRGHALPDGPQPLVVVTIDVGLLGNGAVGRIAPFAVPVDGAAAIIASLRKGFDLLGAGATLTAALDQIEAHARGLHEDRP